ncbi:ABC transporter ATP-binding protein [Pusillimonas sp. ANT_WB101]|uniref:oligopeptide/dipeptide ABC transporter ATP-binding protein n=1 Tax=Pusillimonas sp. ANT_WB101 TaxID=2597356 RepID=UPI0011EBD72F|nr:ABC transporter ATP-binding protein [Pusillimonas sp. ANT_WB101]KAA0891113.1 ABC transporter ATP-binding protein [Pusillimonas sp. ANT_WB101]
MDPQSPVVLALEDVALRFPVGTDWRGRPNRFAHALNGITLAIRKGETLGIVGESGCGKTTLANLLMGLVAPTSGTFSRGDAQLQIVFQDPQSSLDPRLPVWKLIMEPVMIGQRGRTGTAPARQLDTRALRERAGELAVQVGLRREHLGRYPHEFSGGQRQRIAIARAMASEPDVIVLDEPTSALDISVQAQILNLLQQLQTERSLTYVLISHNVSVVRHMCDRVAVMYLGQVVETGPAAAVFAQPLHPYTRLLLDSVPRIGEPFLDGVPQDTELPGNRQLPQGCFFRARCPLATTGCELPQVLAPGGQAGHECRCHVMCAQAALPSA